MHAAAQFAAASMPIFAASFSNVRTSAPGGKVGYDLMDRAHGPHFFLRRSDRRKSAPPFKHNGQAIACRHDVLQRVPPQMAAPIRKVGRNEYREGDLMIPQDGIGVFGVVAIAVVERDAYEAVEKTALG
jgi:hypothetical protein